MDDKWWRKTGTWICALALLWWVLLQVALNMDVGL